MQYIFFIICGYLVGSANTSCLLARSKGLDPHEYGTQNAGATNMAYIYGPKTGLLVAFIDVFKGLLIVSLARIFSHGAPYLDLLSGLSCVLGHIFPIFMDFRGGKGLATLSDVIIATDYHIAILLIMLIVPLIFITHYGVAAAVTASVMFPFLLQLRTGDWAAAAMVSVVSVVMLYKHIPNFKRIANGTEVRFFAGNKAE